MTTINLDADVLGSDGEKVGTVDRIIIHPETHNVVGFIVHEGILFSHDRIIEEEFIERVDGDGSVILNITSDEEEQLPELATRRFTEADDGVLTRLTEMEHTTMPTGSGQVLVMSEPVDDRYAPAPDSPMQPAPSDPPAVHDESNLPDGTVAVEDGAEVRDATGEKVGSIDEVIYDASDRLEAIIIERGHIFKESVRVPANAIDSMTHDEVVLRMTIDEAETAGKAS